MDCYFTVKGGTAFDTTLQQLSSNTTYKQYNKTGKLLLMIIQNIWNKDLLQSDN